MKNNSKKLLSSILAFNLLFSAGCFQTKALDKKYEDSTEYYSFEDAKDASKYENKEIIITDNSFKEEYKIGQYVTVNGRGNEASDGSGNMGYNWNNCEMMIVGIRKNTKYPYACAIVDCDPNVDDVMAWFSEEQLQNGIIDEVNTIKVVTDGGDVRYYAPAGYKVSLDKTIAERVVYKYSDDSIKEISKMYKISLGK